MGGVECVIIIQGEAVQGEAARLAKTAEASCVLVDYLRQDEDEHFNPADGQAVADFHNRAVEKLAKMNAELDKINRDLAAKYSRAVG